MPGREGASTAERPRPAIASTSSSLGELINLTSSKILPFATTLLDLEGISLSKISLTGKRQIYHFDCMWNIFKKITTEQQNKLIEEDNRLVVTGGEGSRGNTKWIKGVNCMVMDGN